MTYHSLPKQTAKAAARFRVSNLLASVLGKITGRGAVFAAAFALVLGLAVAPAARAQSTVIWTNTTTSGTWNYSTQNWMTTGTSGTATVFTGSDAAVFRASGTEFLGGEVVIYTGSIGGVVIAPQAYDGVASGTNPGMIVESGSWHFSGDKIVGGAIQVTGTSFLAFSNYYTTGTRGMDQRIFVDDDQTLTLAAHEARLIFDGEFKEAAGNGRSISTGTGANLVLTTSSTNSSSMTFFKNAASGLGGAIYSGGDLTITGSNFGVTFYNNSASGTGNTSHYSSAAYVRNQFTLSDGAALVGEGGFAAQNFQFTDATLVSQYASGYSGSTSSGRMVFTVLDADGNIATGADARDKIEFNNMQISGSFGIIATSSDANIIISGSNNVNILSSSSINYVKVTIEAPLSGSGAITKTGGGMLVLSGSNTAYTGTTTVSGGLLVGNVSENSALVIDSGAQYWSGTGTATALDRTFMSLNGSGYVDMKGKNLTLQAGDFGQGTIVTGASTGALIKTGTDVFIIGTATAAALDINEGSLVVAANKQVDVSTGTATLAATATLGVYVGKQPSLTAGKFVTGGPAATIDIAGYDDFTQSGASYTLVKSTQIISGTYRITVAGEDITSVVTSTSQFLLVTNTSSLTEIKVGTRLVWENNETNGAHGTFEINTGSFTLGAGLADNVNAINGGTASFEGWDGKSLTKNGAGTLVLTGTNTYTGTTHVRQGTLYNTGAIKGAGADIGPVIVAAGATLVNTGTIAGDTDNAGTFIFQSAATTITGTDGTSTTTYHTGAIGNMRTTGTFVFDLDADYAYTGTISGDAGLIRKTGAATVTLNGAYTHTGDLTIEDGQLAAGKARMFDPAANITITGTGSVLNLGGYDHTLKNVVMTNGTLRFGPDQPVTGAPYADYASVKINALSGTASTLVMRTDYGAITNGVTRAGGLPMGDQLTLSGTTTGDYKVIISNRDSQTPRRLTAGHRLIMIDPANPADNVTATFSGTTESGIGLLFITRGDAESTIFSDPNVWYLADSNKLTNTADSILSTASAAGLEWGYLLDSVRQRMGDLRQEALMTPPQTKQSPLAYTTVTSAGGNLWLRANTYRIDATNEITGLPFDETVGTISLGGDKTYRWEDNQYLLGAYLTFSHVSRDFSASGDNATNTKGLGLYFTYLKDNGWYGDTTFLITGNKNKLNAYSVDGFYNTAEYNATTWGLSLEVGRLIKNKRNGWWVEPALQYAYARVGGASYTTSNNIYVDYESANVNQYRAQIRVGRDRAGVNLKPYAKLGLAGVSTTAGLMRADNRYFRPDMDGSRLEAGAGMSYLFDERSQLYMDYEYAKASSYTRPWAFSVGYRRTW